MVASNDGGNRSTAKCDDSPGENIAESERDTDPYK